MRALQSLGYEARSLDFDDRFVDAMREMQARRRLQRAPRPRRRRRTRSGAARVSGAFRIPAAAWKPRRSRWTNISRRNCSRPRDCRPLLGICSISRGGTLPLLARFARSAARRQAALRGLVGRRRDRADARAVDQRDAVGIEKLRADSGRGVRRRPRVYVRRPWAKKRCRCSRSSRTATSSTRIDAKYEPGGSTHVVPARIDDRSGRAHADAGAVDAPACSGCATTRAPISS